MNGPHDDGGVLLRPELAWVNGRFQAGVGVLIDEDTGRILKVLRNGAAGTSEATARAVPLPRRALLPGFVNAHSHAFQRLIRGRTQWRRADQTAGSDFWSWRDAMYAAALTLSAEDVFHVARWCFLEMMRTGITAVGEFHYLHHQPDGRPYPDRNELAHRVIAAAEEVGMRIALLNVCYAAGGIGVPLEDRQRRFGTESPELYLEHTEALLESGESASGLVTVGVAPHSIRAVPRDWLGELRDFALSRDLPLHMHVAEQPAEVEASVDAFGLRPIELLATDGLLDDRFTAVHATHLTDAEVELLGEARAGVCACPTTERDLADGFLRGRDLIEAGVTLCLGTDSHTNLDFLEEMRLVEYHERLQRLERVVIAEDDGAGTLSAAPPLLAMATAGGARSLRLDAGAIEAGRVADLMAVDLDHPSLLGVPAEHLGAGLALAATPDGVRDVWVAGVRRLDDGHHAIQTEAAEAFRAVAARA